MYMQYSSAKEHQNGADTADTVVPFHFYNGGSANEYMAGAASPRQKQKLLCGQNMGPHRPASYTGYWRKFLTISPFSQRKLVVTENINIFPLLPGFLQHCRICHLQ
jgi:hypothetical protein